PCAGIGTVVAVTQMERADAIPLAVERGQCLMRLKPCPHQPRAIAKQESRAVLNDARIFVLLEHSALLGENDGDAFGDCEVFPETVPDNITLPRLKPRAPPTATHQPERLILLGQRAVEMAFGVVRRQVKET